MAKKTTPKMHRVSVHTTHGKPFKRTVDGVLQTFNTQPVELEVTDEGLKTLMAEHNRKQRTATKDQNGHEHIREVPAAVLFVHKLDAPTPKDEAKADEAKA